VVGLVIAKMVKPPTLAPTMPPTARAM